MAAEFQPDQGPSLAPLQALVLFLLRCCAAALDSMGPRGMVLGTFTAMGDMGTDTDMLTGAETGPHTHIRATHSRLTTLFCTLTAVPPPLKRAHNRAGITVVCMDISIALIKIVVSLASEQCDL